MQQTDTSKECVLILSALDLPLHTLDSQRAVLHPPTQNVQKHVQAAAQQHQTPPMTGAKEGGGGWVGGERKQGETQPNLEILSWSAFASTLRHHPTEEEQRARQQREEQQHREERSAGEQTPITVFSHRSLYKWDKNLT